MEPSHILATIPRWVSVKMINVVSDNRRFSFEHRFSGINLCIANYFCAKIVYPQIACGMDHTLLLSDEGEVFSCGWGADGQTGKRAECICQGNWFCEQLVACLFKVGAYSRLGTIKFLLFFLF